MSLFFAMLAKLFPLYATMGAGVALGKRIGAVGQALAHIQIYLLLPLVTLTSLMKLSFSAELFVMPCVRFALCLAISAITFGVMRKLWGSYAPLLAHAGGASNIGYLGIPLAAALFPADFLPVYILTSVGGTIYENSFGYYWMARGRYTSRDAVRNLLKTPLLYAVVLGLVFNLMGVTLPEMWRGVERDFLGAFVVLGALIIGIGLAQNERLRINIKLNSIIICLKFLVWPAATVGVLALFRLTSFAVPRAYEPILLLMGVLPMAANTAVLASLFDYHADEAATAVALSTLLSIFIVPLYVTLFGFAHV